MTPDSFDELHNLIKPCITKQDTRFRDAISSKERLGLTLRGEESAGNACAMAASAAAPVTWRGTNDSASEYCRRGSTPATYGRYQRNNSTAAPYATPPSNVDRTTPHQRWFASGERAAGESTPSTPGGGTEGGRRRRRSGSGSSRTDTSSPEPSDTSRASTPAAPPPDRHAARRTPPAHHHQWASTVNGRPLAICVRNLPTRSTDSSLKDGLYHEYKKHGKVVWVKVVGQNADRYAVVRFKKPSDVDKALEVSQDKLFFGCKISVAPHQNCDEDAESAKPYETDIDEYHPKATRTLFIGNLEKDVTQQQLRDKFKHYGRIIEIDIKKGSGGGAGYAFCQYQSISSVVEAIRAMDGEYVGGSRVKLGFGKPVATTCVWVDGLTEHTEKQVLQAVARCGAATSVCVDRAAAAALVHFEQAAAAGACVRELRRVAALASAADPDQPRLAVDYASRECQEAFYEQLEKHGGSAPLAGSERLTGDTSTRYIPSVRHEQLRYDGTRTRAPSFSRGSSRTPRYTTHEHYDPAEYAADRRYRVYEELGSSPQTDDTPYEDRLQSVVVSPHHTHRHRRDSSPEDRKRSKERHRSVGGGSRRSRSGSRGGSAHAHPAHTSRRRHRRRRDGSDSRGSRAGTPLRDEPDAPPAEPRRPPRERPPLPMSLPLPKFAAQLLRTAPPTPRPAPAPAAAPDSPPRPPSASSSSTGSAPHSPSLEERIRSLDEKYEKWSGSRALADAPDRARLRHRLLEVDINEVKPSEVVRSLLAKRSVFDEDSERLEGAARAPSPGGSPHTRPSSCVSRALRYPFPSHPPHSLVVPTTTAPGSTPSVPLVALPVGAPLPPLPPQPPPSETESESIDRPADPRLNRPERPYRLEKLGKFNESDYRLDSRVRLRTPSVDKLQTEMIDRKSSPSADRDKGVDVEKETKREIENKKREPCSIEREDETNSYVTDVVKDCFDKIDSDIKNIERSLMSQDGNQIEESLKRSDDKFPTLLSSIKMERNFNQNETLLVNNNTVNCNNIESDIIKHHIKKEEFMTFEPPSNKRQSPEEFLFKRLHHIKSETSNDEDLKPKLNCDKNLDHCSQLFNNFDSKNIISSTTQPSNHLNAVNYLDINKKVEVKQELINNDGNEKSNSNLFDSFHMDKCEKENIVLENSDEPMAGCVILSSIDKKHSDTRNLEENVRGDHDKLVKYTKERLDKDKHECEREKSKKKQDKDKKLKEETNSHKLNSERSEKIKIEKDLPDKNERDIEKTKHADDKVRHDNHKKDKTEKEKRKEASENEPSSTKLKREDKHKSERLKKDALDSKRDHVRKEHDAKHNKPAKDENSRDLCRKDSTDSSTSRASHDSSKIKDLENHEGKEEIKPKPKLGTDLILKHDVEKESSQKVVDTKCDNIVKIKSEIKEEKRFSDNHLKNKSDNHSEHCTKSKTEISEKQRHYSLDSFGIDCKRKERVNSCSSLPPNIGHKRRLSSQDSLDCQNEDIKKCKSDIKCIERRDSKDCRSNDRHKTTKFNKGHFAKIIESKTKDDKKNQVKPPDECFAEIKDSENKEISPVSDKTKHVRKSPKEGIDEKILENSDAHSDALQNDLDFLATLELRSSEEDEKQKALKKEMKEKKRIQQLQQIQELQMQQDALQQAELLNKLKEDKKHKSEDKKKELARDKRMSTDRKSKDDKNDNNKRKNRKPVHSSDSSDSDEPKKHSIFDIIDDEPTYISMYDKVKARSCKNMQKQEEEKRQEKIKAKFSQLKQSRAKREEKKRSSWDEDSDSDHERRKSHKTSMDSSSEDEQIVLHGKKREKSQASSVDYDRMKTIDYFNAHTIEEDSRNKLSRKNSRTRILSDTTDDESSRRNVYRSPDFGTKIKKEFLSDSESQQGSRETEILLKELGEDKVKKTSLLNLFGKSDSDDHKVKSREIDNDFKMQYVKSITNDLSSETESVTSNRNIGEIRKKHKKKQKRYKLPFSDEEVKLESNNEFENDAKHKNSEKLRRHSTKKEKRKDKIRDSVDVEECQVREDKIKHKKDKKSPNHSFELLQDLCPNARKDGKMEDIFGPLSDDSDKERNSHKCSNNKIDYTLHDFESTISNQIDQVEQHLSTEDTKSMEKDENKRKRDKKRKDKKYLVKEDDNSLDVDAVSKAIEARLFADASSHDDNRAKNEFFGNQTISEHKLDDISSRNDYSKSIDRHYDKFKKEFKDREKRKKKKKNKEDRQNRRDHHHFHHHDKVSKLEELISLEKTEEVLPKTLLKDIPLPSEIQKVEITTKSDDCKSHSESPSLPRLTDTPPLSSSDYKTKNESDSSKIIIIETENDVQHIKTIEINEIPMPPTYDNTIQDISEVPLPKDPIPPNSEQNKQESFLPSFDIDDNENAVRSISNLDIEPEKPVEKIDSHSSKIDKKVEEKPRAIISQEETEDAVAALLGESFGGKENTFANCYEEVENDSVREIEIQSTVTENDNIPEEDAEEMRQAVQNLNASEMEIKPDTPVSDNDLLLIDTDTEDADEIPQDVIDKLPVNIIATNQSLNNNSKINTSKSEEISNIIIAKPKTTVVHNTSPDSNVTKSNETDLTFTLPKKDPVQQATSTATPVITSWTLSNNKLIEPQLLNISSTPLPCRDTNENKTTHITTNIIQLKPSTNQINNSVRPIVNPVRVSAPYQVINQVIRPQVTNIQPPTIKIPESHVLYQKQPGIVISPRTSCDPRMSSPKASPQGESITSPRLTNMAILSTSPQTVGIRSPNALHQRSPGQMTVVRMQQPPLSPIQTMHIPVGARAMVSPNRPNSVLVQTQGAPLHLNRLPVAPILTPISKQMNANNLLQQNKSIGVSSSSVTHQPKIITGDCRKNEVRNITENINENTKILLSPTRLQPNTNTTVMAQNRFKPMQNALHVGNVNTTLHMPNKILINRSQISDKQENQTQKSEQSHISLTAKPIIHVANVSHSSAPIIQSGAKPVMCTIQEAHVPSRVAAIRPPTVLTKIESTNSVDVTSSNLTNVVMTPLLLTTTGSKTPIRINLKNDVDNLENAFAVSIQNKVLHDKENVVINKTDSSVATEYEKEHQNKPTVSPEIVNKCDTTDFEELLKDNTNEIKVTNDPEKKLEVNVGKTVTLITHCRERKNSVNISDRIESEKEVSVIETSVVQSNTLDNDKEKEDKNAESEKDVAEVACSSKDTTIKEGEELAKVEKAETTIPTPTNSIVVVPDKVCKTATNHTKKDEVYTFPTVLSSDNENDSQTKSLDDNDYWSAKDINIDSVIKKVDSLCNDNNEIIEKKSDVQKINEIPSSVSTYPVISNTSEAESTKSSDRQSEYIFNNPLEELITEKATPTNRRGGRNSRGKRTDRKQERVQTRQISKPARGTGGGKRGRGRSKIDKKIKSLVNNTVNNMPGDVYDFHEDSGDETTTSPNKTETRPRLILTIKSPLSGHSNVVASSTLSITTKDQLKNEKVIKDDKIASFASPSSNTRKSRRLQEKDVQRTTVDDVIDDVIKGSSVQTKTKEGNKRRLTRQVGPKVDKVQNADTRKSPRGVKRTRDRSLSDASVDSCDEKIKKEETVKEIKIPKMAENFACKPESEPAPVIKTSSTPPVISQPPNPAPTPIMKPPKKMISEISAKLASAFDAAASATTIMGAASPNVAGVAGIPGVAGVPGLAGVPGVSGVPERAAQHQADRAPMEADKQSIPLRESRNTDFVSATGEPSDAGFARHLVDNVPGNMMPVGATEATDARVQSPALPHRPPSTHRPTDRATPVLVRGGESEAEVRCMGSVGAVSNVVAGVGLGAGVTGAGVAGAVSAGAGAPRLRAYAGAASLPRGAHLPPPHHAKQVAVVGPHHHHPGAASRVTITSVPSISPQGQMSLSADLVRSPPPAHQQTSPVTSVYHKGDGMYPHFSHQHYQMYQQHFRATQHESRATPSPYTRSLEAEGSEAPTPPLELRRPPSARVPRPTHSPAPADRLLLCESGYRVPPAHGVHGAVGARLPAALPPPAAPGPPHASQVPREADSLQMLLRRYPVLWQGLLALKNDAAAVQMHFVGGNPGVAGDTLTDGCTSLLRIAQRMRLEPAQLDQVHRKMKLESEHCILLALPCGRDHMDVLQQSNNLTSGFITYLQRKQAAGIVNVAPPGHHQAVYTVHIFPSCDFANENLNRIAPDLMHRVADIAHLLIVIATV
ncbi:unnamed protein product [Parnassius apollo]|uniref:(apollo) hypothetical protein n=1 Tax=Parnassius apollo TaxID=110799 RepID=A0A8S3W5N2_PARAO|nr:unnamed protein product [Parnassius apollo]